jgi:uncharacterized membrane protein YccC
MPARRLPSLLRRVEGDLSIRQFGLDVKGLNWLEGLRAALTVAVVVAVSEFVATPAAAEAALAAWLTCLCDQGGPIRSRLPAVISFTLLGAAVTVAAGLARDAGPFVAVPFAAIGLFALSFARVYGASATVVANLAGVSLVLAIDQPANLGRALTLGLGFLAGGAWAAVLTMAIWRMRPFLPALRAVSNVYDALATLSRDLLARIADPARAPSGWAEHARAHRRNVRDQIEQARSIVADTMRARGAGPRAGQALIRLEAAEQIFEALIALSELLEHGRPGDTEFARHLLRRLRSLLLVFARAIRTDSTRANPRIGPAIDRIAADIGTLSPLDPLHGVADALVERLRIALTLNIPANYYPASTPDGTRPPWRVRIVSPLLANLFWNSLALRHALRVGLVALPAIAITVIWYGPYERWLTITMVVTLQPQIAPTITRALERIGGTVIGGLFAAVLSLICRTPLTMTLALFPLATAALAIRKVSFGAFIAAITPIVVLLSELGRPNTSEIEIAALRALFTLIGGLLALGGAFLLWPSWEPSRLPVEIRAAIAAHAAFARAAFSRLMGEPGDLVAIRRAAGLASNNLEASISRALQEPRHINTEGLNAVMVIDAGMRRIAGRLTAMLLDPELTSTLDRSTLAVWRDWAAGALDTLAKGSATLGPRPVFPAGPAAESFGRLARQIELLAGAMPRLPA